MFKTKKETLLTPEQGKARHAISKKEQAAIKAAYKADLKKREAEIREAKKALIPENRKKEKRRRARLVIPRTVADTVPFIADYEDGIIECSPGRYSRSYFVNDINYRTGNDAEQVAAFVAYGAFINYFPEDMTVQVTVDNRVVSMSEQEKKVYYPMAGDGYDDHRKEYNSILKRQIMSGRNDIIQNRYITVALEAATPQEAIMLFAKMDVEIISNIKKIGAAARVMPTEERLELLHDKFNRGHEGEFAIDFEWVMKQGLSSKNYISPTSFFFGAKDSFMTGDAFFRVMYLSNLPASLSDEFLTDLAACEFPLMVTTTIQPMAQDKALRLVRKQITGMESNKIDAEKRALRSGYSPETINHELRHSLQQAEELLDDMLNKDQKMFFVTITVIISGDTPKELTENSDTISGKARKFGCQLKSLSFQQEDGMRLTLPLGHSPKTLSVERTLTTESTAVFMPFSAQELFQEGGFYYGINQISRNLILCDRTGMKTPSGFILGSSGSGKSFATKREMLNVLLNDGETGVLVIDPENEYGDFARAFGGEVIKISADSSAHINPMDMPEDYGLDEDDGDSTPMHVKKDKAIRKKSDYIMSIIEKMTSSDGSDSEKRITPGQKTVIDRCVRKCYAEYLDHDFDTDFIPTLKDLQAALDTEAQTSESAAGIAEAVEYYTKGSMDIFSHTTNMDIHNRFVVFNVRDLGDQLRPIALIIMFDYIWNKMIENKSKGKRTYCYCDEIHVMFASYYSAYFLKQLYKRGRKYGMVITGITQNIEELLLSETARGMIGNSDFLLMLNQAPEDLKILAHMLGISPTQMGYVQNAEAGSGLLKAQGTIVPFSDHFPAESYLYGLMSTRFGEITAKQTEVDDE